MQKTLQCEVSLSGEGLFSGTFAQLKILPAPLGHGIVFERVDLQGKPRILASLSSAREALRSTSLMSKYGSVDLVEHLLSSLFACEIDHALIQLDGPEIPILDGSSREFVEALEKAGVQSLDCEKDYLAPLCPVFWSEGDVHIIALPSDSLRVSYTLHYPQSPLIGSQFYSCYPEKSFYCREIAPSRTFALYEEIAPLLARGLFRGRGFESGLVIQGDKVLNPDGIRFTNEPARHKILDLLGDLSLIGKGIKAHIIAIRSGHASNVAFAKVFKKEVLQQTRGNCDSLREELYG